MLILKHVISDWHRRTCFGLFVVRVQHNFVVLYGAYTMNFNLHHNLVSVEAIFMPLFICF